MDTDVFVVKDQRTYEYEAFISYRHLEPDTSIAVALHQALERFVIPPSIRKSRSSKKIGRIFRDQEELPTSSDLGRDIETALKNSRWLIVVCSPRLLQSQWCMREVDSFIEQGRRDSILTLLVEGEPSGSFPPRIRFVNIDGVEVEMEPLAADVRAATLKDMKKRLKREKLRLLAPMLGVPFDGLYQRAKKYARKKAAVILGIISAALVLFGGIVGYQAIQTAQANKLAGMEQITKLIAKSESYVADGRQDKAVGSAAEALELAQQHRLYEKEAEAALYRAIVNFPADGSYAKLEHNADIIETVFSPDGSRIALFTQDNHITVWDTPYGVKRYTIELTPDIYLLESACYNMQGDDTNWCSFAFNAQNELFVLDLSNQVLSQYGDNGEVLREVTEDFGCGVEYQTYLYSEEFVLYRPAVVYLSGADVMVVSSFVTDSPASPAFDAALLAYDAKTCEKLYEYRFEPDSHYPIATQLSCDEQSLACYYVEIGVGMTVCVLNADVIRSTASFQEYDFSEETSAYFIYLYDGVFLTLDLQNEYAVLDADTMGKYAVLGIAPPKEEDDASIMMAGQQRGEFYAGFQSSLVNYYSFDGSEVSLLRTEIDVNEHTGSGTWIARFGWANKDEGTITYVCDMISETCRRVVMGERLYYRDYQYPILTENYIFSDQGYYAETEANICILYNFNKSSSDFSRAAISPRNQSGPAYADMEQGLIITEGSDEGGFYFEVYSLDTAQATALHKVYLPGTEGYNVYEDEAPYHSVTYGKDYAAILTWQMGNADDNADSGDLGTATMYTLYYRDGILRVFPSWKSDYPEVAAINEQGLIVGTLESFRQLDPQNPETVSETEAIEFFSTEWLATKVPFGRGNGPSARNIILWPFVERLDGGRQKLAYLDLDTYQYIESDTNYENDVNYPVLWSDSGSIFFALDGLSNFNAYNIDKMTMLNRGDFPEDIVKMQKIGGNIIALFSSQNAVEFYDMDSCKKLSAIDGDVEAILHIGYNESNGLAVVSRKSGFEIIDVRSGDCYLAPVQFGKSLDADQTVEMYITNDVSTLFGCTLRSKESDGGIVRYWCNYFTQDLMDADTLLQIARRFG